MSDTYQAVYDAVRSKIGGCDVGSVLSEAIRQAFDISWAMEYVKTEYLNAAMEQQRPSMMLKPKISMDGNQWVALYGENLQDGVAGFGISPAEAFADFDKNWHAKLPEKQP